MYVSPPFHRGTDERTEAQTTQPVRGRVEIQTGVSQQRAHALNCCFPLFYSHIVPAHVMTDLLCGMTAHKSDEQLTESGGWAQGLQEGSWLWT